MEVRKKKEDKAEASGTDAMVMVLNHSLRRHIRSATLSSERLDKEIKRTGQRPVSSIDD